MTFRWRLWLDRFPGIPDLPLLIVSSHAVVYLFDLVRPGLSQLLVLSPAQVYAGEYWRLITFLFVTPFQSPLWAALWFYMLYAYASALEHTWGSGRFSAFYLLTALLTSLSGLAPFAGIVDNAYLNGALFLAFSALFPDQTVLLFFIIPIKVKWLGFVTLAWFIYSLIMGAPLTQLSVLAALLTLTLFFGKSTWLSLSQRWRLFRWRTFKKFE